MTSGSGLRLTALRRVHRGRASCTAGRGDRHLLLLGLSLRGSIWIRLATLGRCTTWSAALRLHGLHLLRVLLLAHRHLLDVVLLGSRRHRTGWDVLSQRVERLEHVLADLRSRTDQRKQGFQLFDDHSQLLDSRCLIPLVRGRSGGRGGAKRSLLWLRRAARSWDLFRHLVNGRSLSADDRAATCDSWKAWGFSS